MHTVSVLMPAKNPGKYLASAVNSILSQQAVTLDLIIVDDHSTDHSINALQNDQRIKVIQNEGNGLVNALNTGLKYASYQMIARMDSDDIAHPQRLMTQINYLEDNPSVDIAGSKVSMFCDVGAVSEGYQHYAKWINGLCDHEQIHAQFFVESPIAHPTAVFRKTTIEQLGGYQDLTWPEDYDLWCRAWLAGMKFGKPDTDNLLYWRDHSSRTSRQQHRYSKQQFLLCKAHYLSKYLHKIDVHNVTVWGAGPTGLKTHDYLQEKGIQVTGFVDVNPKLFKQRKRNKPVTIIGKKFSNQELTHLDTPFVIAISTRGVRQQIENALQQQGYKPMKDFILFA